MLHGCVCSCSDVEFIQHDTLCWCYNTCDGVYVIWLIVSVCVFVSTEGYFVSTAACCYCETCHKQRSEPLYYRRGEPAKDYSLPIGWSKFAIRFVSIFLPSTCYQCIKPYKQRKSHSELDSHRALCIDLPSLCNILNHRNFFLIFFHIFHCMSVIKFVQFVR